MGNAQAVLEQARTREPRPEPPADALRSGARQAQADGSITVHDWDQAERRPGRSGPAPVVDRAPASVFD